MSISKEQFLQDYKIAFKSRQTSLLGRKEVLTGKAKFGIFGDGKELGQVAMARACQNGDWRAGYYRDQTFMFAKELCSVKQFFSQLYAHADIDFDPSSGGRQMNAHFATRYLDHDSNWLSQLDGTNVASDISPTAGQMARSVGLAYASKYYRKHSAAQNKMFSSNGNEVCFVTIGNASTAEGVFWESLNAAGVLQIPLVIVVWDDDFGISVPNKYQMTKENISEITSGFHPSDSKPGVSIYQTKGWDYENLIQTFEQAAQNARQAHAPALIHVQECTQPQGHSTSGSHERYKDEKRLRYEQDNDCINKMRKLIVDKKIVNESTLSEDEKEWAQEVRQEQKSAWQSYREPLENQRNEAVELLHSVDSNFAESLEKKKSFSKETIHSHVRQALLLELDNQSHDSAIAEWLKSYQEQSSEIYNTHLHAPDHRSPLSIATVPAKLGDKEVDGRQVIQAYFKWLLKNDDRVFIIGEDVGKIGGVNSEFEGIQAELGEIRCGDTGIREATILGQGYGAALRGLRPIVDIQYLDYLLYCFQTLSDDVASLRYRTAGGQAAPVIIRTKGHRLEGIWHSGSPIGTIVNGIRGLQFCVPRNMVQAIGFYQTLMQGDDPALVIEVLNAYRMKEVLPENIGEYCLELGVPEVLLPGRDITLVTYGACVQVAMEAAKKLASIDIEVEVVDVQTLLPFDKYNIIGTSIEKTHSVLFLDEDVPGGASAYMMQQVLDRNNNFDILDAKPRCMSAEPHRPAYANDGDYYTKPNCDDVMEAVYLMLQERSPELFPKRIVKPSSLSI